MARKILVHKFTSTLETIPETRVFHKVYDENFKKTISDVIRHGQAWSEPFLGGVEQIVGMAGVSVNKSVSTVENGK